MKFHIHRWKYHIRKERLGMRICRKCGEMQIQEKTYGYFFPVKTVKEYRVILESRSQIYESRENKENIDEIEKKKALKMIRDGLF